MFALKPGLRPDGFTRVCARGTLVFGALAVAGCASTSSPNTQAFVYPGDRQIVRPQHVAEAVVDVEADGLPAQTPPSQRARQLADDPTEPWSKNYGGENPSRAPIEAHDDVQPLHKTPDKSPAPNIPQDLPPQFRKQLAAAISSEQDE